MEKKINFAFLDSGVGGLPYLLSVKKYSPLSSCVYIADTINFPYGEKSQKQIIENASCCAQKIISRWAPHTIVVACNTISVTALEELRKCFPDTPFVGTVPAIKPASVLSKKRCIGLLATNATVNHPYTKRLILDFASDCKIVSRGDPELISFIEHRCFSASKEEKENAVRPAVDFFKNAGCDSIVLACTHFLNMADVIQDVAGKEITVVDSREGVSRHALEVEHCKTQEQENEKSLHEKTELQNIGELNDSLFVTGFTKEKDEENYKLFCKHNGISFGGIV